jgi:hypothetical protein
MQTTLEVLKPFVDLIHQIEADKPALGKCYAAVLLLDKHIENMAMRISPEDGDVLKRTWERRRDNTGPGATSVQPILQPAHTVAYLLDPMFAVADGGDMVAPKVSMEREKLACELVKRVGGAVAGDQFMSFLSEGWHKDLKDQVQKCTQPTGEGERKQVASVRMRKGVWKRWIAQQMPELAAVAVRVMSVHPTSCSTERNWGLWGRMYTACRYRLGMERAKKMITFCFNNRAMTADSSDFALNLAIIEGDTDHDV